MAIVRVPVSTAPRSTPPMLEALERVLTRAAGATPRARSEEIVGQADEPRAWTMVSAAVSIVIVALLALLFDMWFPDSTLWTGRAAPGRRGPPRRGIRSRDRSSSLGYGLAHVDILGLNRQHKQLKHRGPASPRASPPPSGQ
jgi:hypothetical protein